MDYQNMATSSTTSSSPYEIIDIGGSRLHEYLLKALQRAFFNHPKGDAPYVSDIFVSTDEGLQLWSTITFLPTSYQTREEINLFRRWGTDIAKHIRPGSSLFDLGSGATLNLSFPFAPKSDVKKITPLLDCLESLHCDITYYCLDVSRASLTRGLETLTGSSPSSSSSSSHSSLYRHIHPIGLWGTFDDVKKYLAGRQNPLDLTPDNNPPKVLISLGAEIGNDSYAYAQADLTSWRALMGPDDLFFLGIDGTQDKDKIWNSYHGDPGLKFHELIRTGMKTVNETLSRGHGHGHDCQWFRDEDWKLDGQIRENPLSHQFVFTALRDVVCPAPGGRDTTTTGPDPGLPLRSGISFRKGDRFECCQSHRKTPAEMRELFRACGLGEIAFWKSPTGEMYDYLLVPEEWTAV
ncbi:hypothetical protein ABEF95_005525 [Exophiala dermatitidis]